MQVKLNMLISQVLKIIVISYLLAYLAVHFITNQHNEIRLKIDNYLYFYYRLECRVHLDDFIGIWTSKLGAHSAVLCLHFFTTHFLLFLGWYIELVKDIIKLSN